MSSLLYGPIWEKLDEMNDTMDRTESICHVAEVECYGCARNVVTDNPVLSTKIRNLAGIKRPSDQVSFVIEAAKHYKENVTHAHTA